MLADYTVVEEIRNLDKPIGAARQLPEREPQRRAQLGARHPPPAAGRAQTPGDRQEEPQSPAHGVT